MELGNLMFGHSRGRYKVPRGFGDETYEWDDRFQHFLENIGCDGYGHAKNENNPYINSRGGITTKLFTINPYWWGDGDDENEAEKPNFIYNPTGYSLMWYKYPLRDSYSNERMTFKEFDAMLRDCEAFYHG